MNRKRENPYQRNKTKQKKKQHKRKGKERKSKMLTLFVAWKKKAEMIVFWRASIQIQQPGCQRPKMDRVFAFVIDANSPQMHPSARRKIENNRGRRKTASYVLLQLHVYEVGVKALQDCISRPLLCIAGELSKRAHTLRTQTGTPQY